MFLRCPELSYNKLQIRHADKHDIAILKKWDKQEHVRASGGQDDYIDWHQALSKPVIWASYLIAMVNNKPVGFLAVIDPALEETHYWGKISSNLAAVDIWIGEKDYLNKGWGRLMMSLTLDQLFAQNVSAVLVDPLFTNQRACIFYEKLGFKKKERRVFGNDDCLVYQITRSVWSNWRAKIFNQNFNNHFS